MSTTFTADWSDLSFAFAEAQRRVLESYGPVIVNAVQAEWPVATGESANAFAYEVVQEGAVVRLSVTNSTDYASFVHRKGEKTSLLDELVDRVAEQFAEQIATDIELALVDILNTPSSPRSI